MAMAMAKINGNGKIKFNEKSNYNENSNFNGKGILPITIEKKYGNLS